MAAMVKNTVETSVCIIGCGPCGIMTLSAFSDAKNRGENIPEVICFEKQDKISGLWNYTWRTGLSADGDVLPNSMYRHLFTNGPKECLEMPDYTFMDHFKKPIPSYPPRAVLQDYLLGKAKKYDIEQFVKLKHVVKSVEENEDKFLVTYEDLTTNNQQSKVFDYVVCATGHYTVPNFPEFPGFNGFDGRIIHSHDFRNPVEFKDKVVVIIGSSFSAEDIALQLYKYKAKRCIITYRSRPLGFKWPDTIIERPALLKVTDGNKFHFSDGSIEKADDVIFCTGYKHHFPFMSQNLRLFVPTNLMYPDHLYKGVILDNNARCLYMGMQNQIYTFTMFHTQGLWVRDYIMGKIQVPDGKGRLEDIKKWYDRGQNLNDIFEMIEFQRDHVISLVEDIVSFPKNHDINLICEQLKRWARSRSDDIITYRDQSYKSPNDGHEAPKPSIPWQKNFDDSIEAFVKNAENTI